MRSQREPQAARCRAAVPTLAATTLEPAPNQVALRRRLRLALPFAPDRCSGRSCRQPLRPPRAACPRSGRLRRFAESLVQAWARAFREVVQGLTSAGAGEASPAGELLAQAEVAPPSGRMPS